MNQQIRAWGSRLGRKNQRRIIVAVTAVLGINALLAVGLLAASWFSPATADIVLSSFLLGATELTTQQPIWLVARLVLQLVVGLLYLWSLLRLWQGHEEAGLNMGIFAALLSLTAVHLLTFYLNQFGSLAGLFANLALFLLLLSYRSWYLVGD